MPGVGPYAEYRVDLPEGHHGKWRVERFVVPEEPTLERLRCAMAGRPVDPGTYTRLMKDGEHDPMMSDTPAEVRDHFPMLCEMRARGGRVLINGLGLGVVVKAALALPNVTRVDVVEIDPDVIALVAPHYSDPRLFVRQGDAFSVEWPKEARWTVAWHDIWPALCADNLPEMTRLHRKYGRRVDWQGSWGKPLLLAQRRRGGW